MQNETIGKAGKEMRLLPLVDSLFAADMAHKAEAQDEQVG